MRQAGFEPTTFGSVFLWSDHRPTASSAPLKAQSARGRTASWGRAAVPVIRKGVGLLLPLTPDSMANDLHAPLRALTAPELPSEGGGPLVLPASRETTRRTPPLESGAPPAGVAAGASRHSSALPSSSNRRSSRACAPPPRSPSASPWPAATARTGCAPGRAAASASAPLRRTATPRNCVLSHALPAGPTDPWAVFPPELRVLGTSPAYAA